MTVSFKGSVGEPAREAHLGSLGGGFGGPLGPPDWPRGLLAWGTVRQGASACVGNGLSCNV